MKKKHKYFSTTHKTKKASSNTYYMYGKHPVLAALKNKRRKIKTIYCLEKFYQQYKNLFSSVEVKIVDSQFLKSKLDEDASHQGVVAEVEKLAQKHPKELIDKNENDRIVILDQITDPQNIGAIIRSAAAFGVNKIIAPADGAPDENAVIAKAACGCLELVEYTKITNISQFLSLLKDNGYWIVGLDGEGKDEIREVAKINKLAIIIGSEGKGMRRLTKESCDYVARIPIASNVESLNASNAASIMLYALTA